MVSSNQKTTELLKVDNCGKILVATITPASPQRKLPLTNNSFQQNPTSFYFAVFKQNFKGLDFGSYFGTVADHYHPGMSRMDNRGILYHSVCSQTYAFPISQGAYAPTKSNTLLDNITFKFAFKTESFTVDRLISGGGANDSRPHAVRGCKAASLHYEITPADRQTVIRYKISGNAINGMDFEWIPDSLVVSAYTTSASIQIKALLSQSASIPDPKHVVINTLSNCPCEGEEFIISSDTVWIYDSLYVNIITSMDTFCRGEKIRIEAEVDPTLSFSWSPANMIPNINSLVIEPIINDPSEFTITAFQIGAPATCPPRIKTYKGFIESNPNVTPDTLSECIAFDSLDIFLHILPESEHYNVSWLPSDFLSDSIGISNKFYAPPGLYEKLLLVVSPRGCISNHKINISILSTYKFDSVIPFDTIISYGDSIRLQVEGNATLWFWSPSIYLSSNRIRNPWVKPLKSMRYSVMGINKYGCRDSAVVKIDLKYPPYAMPNSFSPNNDGLNDLFSLNNKLTDEKIIEFRIFNRYGQLVYNGQNGNMGWDGTFNGIQVDLGVYYYQIMLVLPDGSSLKLLGDVTLIR